MLQYKYLDIFFDDVQMISDPHSMHVFNELTNSIDLLEHAMTITEMSSIGQQQVEEIKQGVFLAENSKAAYDALRGLLEYELPFHNREYASLRNKDAHEPSLLVILSGKTSRWIESDSSDTILDPVMEDVNPAHLDNLDDLRYFRLLYQIDQRLLVFAVRESEGPQPDTAQYRVVQGNDLWFQGSRDKAIALYQEALQLDPQEPEAYIALGEAYREKGKWAQSARMLEQAIRYAPEDADLYRVLGDLYIVQNKASEATQAYAHAIRLSPNNPDLHTRLGDAYLVQGDGDSAANEYARSVQSPYGPAASLVALGDLYTDKGLPERAEKTYLEALALEPDLASAYAGLANLYRAQDKAQEAQAAYETLIEVDPRQLQWYADLADVYLGQGRADAAISLYKTGVKRYPRSKDLYVALGELYLSLARETVR